MYNRRIVDMDVGGRPRSFTPETLELAWQQYFAWCDDNPWYKHEAPKGGFGKLIKIPVSRPYTEAGFCAFHDLGINYIRQLWDSVKDKKDEESTKYSLVLTRARAKCYAQKFEGAAVGAFNANLISRDLELVDRTESDIKQKVTIKHDLSKLSVEELKALRDIKKKLSE